MQVRAGGHQKQEKELTLDQCHPSAQSKGQRGATWPLADRRRWDLPCGRAWWLCDASWVCGCFSHGDTYMQGCQNDHAVISGGTDCTCRCSNLTQCFFCPCHFCNQISRLNTCIHLSISHLAIKLSFHYRGAQTTSIRICFSKWISQIFERKEITLFSLTWRYYREDPPKQCGVNSDSPEPGYLINQGQHNLDQCQTTEDSQLYCCQSLSHPVPLSLTPQKICLDSKHKA